MKVYIAGPYTKGDVGVNIRNAILAADAVLKAGHAPYVPHLNHLWHLIVPGNYTQWLSLDMEWLRECDALIRLDGESDGADKEVEEALAGEMEVFYGVADFMETYGHKS